MDNKKEKISNLELLEAMSGINEKYLKDKGKKNVNFNFTFLEFHLNQKYFVH